jgi:hypothetical protein
MAKIEVFRSRNTTGVAINNQRVTKTKPFGLIQTVQRFEVDDSEILSAIDIPWIKCIERMPKDNSLVLIIGGGHRCIAVYNESKQRFYLDDDYYEVSQVTHWLPVPEIPQEE